MKHILFDSTYCTSVRSLMSRGQSTSSSHFLHCFSRPRHTPLLRLVGYQYSHYVQWLLNAVRRRKPFFILRSTKRCPLCSNHLNDVDARQHLLTECIETLTLRDEYLEDLLSIDQKKAAEYLSMDTWDSWLWILAAGCYPAPPPRKLYSGRRSSRSSIFSVGECYCGN